ncbi:MAG: hypothetical protein N2643_03935 [Endomicrobia bacterium]|nr:hypothetical protein [Endomicrobiia bacterium]
MRDWVEYIFFYYFKIFFLLLPELYVKYVLKTFIILIKFFNYKRQKIAIRNYYLSLPKTPPKEIINNINQVWYNIGFTFIVTFKYIKNPKKIIERIKIENEDFLKELLPNTILFTAHIGNWEILAQNLVLRGYKIAAIVREQRNRYIEYQIKRTREKLGGRVFYAHQLNKIIKWLKSGGIIYLLPDQHIVEGSVRVEFLGRLAFSTPILTLLNKRLGSKIIPIFCIRQKNYYRVYIEKPYIPKYNGNLKEDLEYNTLYMNKIIEKYIKKYPQQWLWLHKRWKDK